MLDLTIIFVSHDHDHLLPGAVAALAPAVEGLSVEVFLVDNLGRPDFGANIGPQPFDVRIFRNAHEQGLSRNTNQTAAAARGKYLLMLNPDTKYERGHLSQAIDYLERTPEAGLLGCRLLNRDGTLQRTYRKFPILPVIFIRGLYASKWPIQPAFYRQSLMEGVVLDRPAPVDWVLGAWLLMRREDFFNMGGMDERFFLYYEDIDLCYRVRQRGQSAIYYPGIVFRHTYARSSAKQPLGRGWQRHASSICKYFWKHGYLLRPRVKALANA